MTMKPPSAASLMAGWQMRRNPRRRPRLCRRRCALRRPRPTSSASFPNLSRASESGSSMSVAIVDYGSGNLHSAAKAFERAARESGHDQPILVTRDPDSVARDDRVVLPGVGAFADCRRGLDAVAGMVEALDVAVRQKGRPFFGICVGM